MTDNICPTGQKAFEKRGIQMSQIGYQLITYGGLTAELHALPSDGGAAFGCVLGDGPAGIARAAARLGCTTALYGRIGADPLGAALEKLLLEDGIDLRQLVAAPGAPTGTALVSRGPEGSSRRVYYGGCAGAGAKTGEFDLHPIAGSGFFCFGSDDLAQRDSRETALRLARYAAGHGCTVVFSPNLHLEMWETEGEEAARRWCREAMKLAGIVKVTTGELDFLADVPDPDRAAGRLMLQYRPRLLLVSLGGEGCLFHSVYGDLRLPGFPVEAAPERDAGEDVFTGAFLARLASNGKAPTEWEIGDIAICVVFANAARAVAAGTGEMPRLDQVEEFLRQRLI